MDLLELPGIRTVRYGYRNGQKKRIIDATTTEELKECPRCGPHGTFHQHGTRTHPFRDVPWNGYRVVIRLTIQRYRCLSCKRTFFPSFGGIDPVRYMTSRCVKWIKEQSMAAPFTEVAEQVGCDQKTVSRIAAEYIAEKDRENPAYLPAWLAIDEAHPAGRKAYCVLSDTERRKPIDVLENTLLKTLLEWLWKFSGSTTLQGVTMDMCSRYRTAVRKAFPSVPIVVDKFHVLRMANDALDDVRISTTGDLPDDLARQLKRDKYLLRKRAKKLSPMKRPVRDDWLLNEPTLKSAYWLKEELFHIYDMEDRAGAAAALDRWRTRVDRKGMSGFFEELLTATGNWRAEILAYFDTCSTMRKTNAIAEAINGNCKILSKIGRGYTFPILRGKLLFASREKLGNARRVDPDDSEMTWIAAHYAEEWLHHPSWLRGLLIMHHGVSCQSCGGSFPQEKLELHRSDTHSSRFEYPFGYRLLCAFCLARACNEESIDMPASSPPEEFD